MSIDGRFPPQARRALLVCAWLALAVRWPGFFANTFHADEALFATWARAIATGRDPFLRLPPVDKPPLLFYLQALGNLAQGPVMWAARLPNLIASVAAVPLLGRLVWRIWRDPAAAVAAALAAALGPFWLTFGASAFTDPLALTLASAALIATAERRPRPAGLWLGLAVAAKYQTLLVWPLAAALAPDGRFWRKAAPTAATVGLGLAGWLWLSGAAARWGNTGDALLLAGWRPIASWELWPRLHAWVAFAPPVWGAPAWLWVAAGAVLLWRRGGAADLVLLTAGLLYAALHWLTAVPIYDRYLLPLALLTAVGGGRALSLLLRGRAAAVWLLALLILAPNAARARAGLLPLGAHPRADDGAAQVAAALADAPYGVVLYDHWYSWQWRYHLFDSGVYVAWVPHPAALIDDLAVFYDGRRYLALPNRPAAEPFLQALAAAGYRARPIAHAGTPFGVTLYTIERNPIDPIREP